MVPFAHVVSDWHGKQENMAKLPICVLSNIAHIYEVVNERDFPAVLGGSIINLSMALRPFIGPLTFFQFLDILHSRQDSLNGRSARRKASTYTQGGTNTE
jgi:hypothetical protein